MPQRPQEQRRVPASDQAAARPTPDLDTVTVVRLGVVAWVLTLAATLLVPALHEGDRSWWPWVPVAGIVLGVLGLAYLHRGRGNAAELHAHRDGPRH